MAEARAKVVRGDLLRFVPHVVLLSGLLLGLAWWEVQQVQHARAVRTQLEFTADQMTKSLVDQVEAIDQILRGASGLLSNGPVSRAEWKGYVDELRLNQSWRGVQAIGFSRRISSDQLAAHQERIRAEGFPDFVVFPAGERPEYSSIDYIEPFSGRNLRAFGYDMLSDPVRHRAMLAAAETGEIVATPRVKLLQETETDVQPGVLIYNPVYRAGALRQTVEQRRAALLGWAYIPLRLGDEMGSIFGRELETVRLEVVDQDASGDGQLYDSALPSLHSQRSVPGAVPVVRTVTLNGRTWQLRYHRLPGYVTAEGLEPSRMEPLLLVVGLSLLVGLAWSLVHTRRRATALAAELTRSLEASEQKYRGTFEQAAIGIAQVSLSRTVLEANERYAEILAYSRDELLGRNIDDFVAEEPHERDHALTEELLAGSRNSYAAEKVYRRKDGTAVIGQLTVSLVRDAEGRPLHFIRALEDITARVEAEQRFRLVAEQAHTGVVVVQGGRVAFANEAVAAMTGRPREQWEHGPGSLLDEWMKPAQGPAPAVADWLASCTRPDGSTVWLMRHDRITSHMGRPAMLSTLVDVTGLRLTQQALEAKSQHFELLLKTSLDAIHVLGLDGQLLEWNDAFLKHLGRDPTEAPGLFVWDWEDRPRDELLALLAAVPPTGQRFESRHRHKDGSLREVEVSVVSVRGKNGEPQVLCAARDITERRRSQDEQARLHKLEALGTLAGGIAHDFNNILTSVYGNLELADAELDATGQPHADLESAKQALMRAKELTQRLVTFASGGAPLKKLLTLPPLMRLVAQSALNNSSMQLEMAVEEDLPAVDADEAQLHQVLSNLLSNARQATEGRGHLLIRFARRRTLPVEAKHLPQGEYVDVEVKDDGPGISPEALGKIFDPFFTTKEFGRGLGLPAAFSIVKRHGGHLWADSKLGEGTTMHLLLPAMEKASAAAPPAPRTQFSIHALVMDDEPGVLRAASRLLKSLGADVDTAVHGDEALRRVNEAVAAGTPYDVVLLDLTVVGGRGGADIVAELRRASPTTHPIVSSGYSDDPVMSSPEAHGFDGVLPKPYSLGELAQALRAAIRQTPGRHLRSV